MNHPDLSLRPAADADLAFLRRVYAESRAAELVQTGWDAAQCDAFIAQQFAAQHAHYHQHFAAARFDLILAGGEPVGRLYVHRRDDEIRIVDIALLAAWRGAGIGTRLLRQLIDEATGRGVAVSIHVEQFNPALSLYRRLGFEHVEDHGVYYLMRRTCAETTTAGAQTRAGASS